MNNNLGPFAPEGGLPKSIPKKRNANEADNQAPNDNKAPKADLDASVHAFLREKRNLYDQMKSPHQRLNQYHIQDRTHLQPSPFYPLSMPQVASPSRYTMTKPVPSALGHKLSTHPTMSTLNPRMLSQYAPPKWEQPTENTFSNITHYYAHMADPTPFIPEIPTDIGERLKHHEMFTKTNKNGLTLLDKSILKQHMNNVAPNANPLFKKRWNDYLVKNDMAPVNNKFVHTFAPLQSTITTGMGDKALDNLTTNIANWLGSPSMQFVQSLSALEINHSVTQPHAFHESFHTDMAGRLVFIMSQMNLNLAFLIENDHLRDWGTAEGYTQHQRLSRLTDQNAIVLSMLRCLEAYRYLHLHLMDLKSRGSNIKAVAKHIQIVRGDMPLTDALQERTTQKIITPHEVPWNDTNVNKLKESIQKNTPNYTSETKQLHGLIRELIRNNGSLAPNSQYKKLASQFISDSKLRSKLHLDAFKDTQEQG